MDGVVGRGRDIWIGSPALCYSGKVYHWRAFGAFFYNTGRMNGRFSKNIRMLPRIFGNLSDKAKDLTAEEASLELQTRLFQKEAERREIGQDQDKAHRRTFMQLWTMHPQRFKMSEQEAGAGQRPSNVQSNFRANLAVVMDSKHPDDRSRELWCPVAGSLGARQDSECSPRFPVLQWTNNDALDLWHT